MVSENRHECPNAFLRTALLVFRQTPRMTSIECDGIKMTRIGEQDKCIAELDPAGVANAFLNLSHLRIELLS
jgi:hypothetical protein